MAIDLMVKVWEHEELGRLHTLVLLALADAADCRTIEGEIVGVNCYPSLGRVARRARCSRRTVMRAVAELEERGYIERRLRAGRNTDYTLTIDRGRALTSDTMSPVEGAENTPDTPKNDPNGPQTSDGVSPPTTSRSRNGEKPVTPCHPTSDTLSPLADEPVTSCHGGGDTRCHGGGDTAVSPDPSLPIHTLSKTSNLDEGKPPDDLPSGGNRRQGSARSVREIISGLKEKLGA